MHYAAERDKRVAQQQILEPDSGTAPDPLDGSELVFAEVSQVPQVKRYFSDFLYIFFLSKTSF